MYTVSHSSALTVVCGVRVGVGRMHSGIYTDRALLLLRRVGMLHRSIAIAGATNVCVGMRVSMRDDV